MNDRNPASPPLAADLPDLGSSFRLTDLILGLRADTNLDSNLLGCPPRWNGQRLLKSMESDVFILPDAGLTAVVYSGKHAYISCQVPTTAYHMQSSRTRWRANMYLYEVYQSRMWNDNCWISAEIRISIACCFYLPLFALFLES